MREHECNMQTSGIHGTLGDRPCGRPGVHARIWKRTIVGDLINATFLGYLGIEDNEYYEKEIDK